MGETVWADRPNGGQVPFDPDTCERFPLQADDWPRHSLYLHRKPGGAVLIYAEEPVVFYLHRKPDGAVLI
jgi:hypothetical protein